MANKKVLKSLNEESTVINNLKDLWGINQGEIVQTAKRFFEDYKKFEKETQTQKISLLGMHVRYISESKNDLFLIPSLEKELTLYFANVKTHLAPLVVTTFSFRKTTKLLSLSTTNSSLASSRSPNTSTFRPWKPYWSKTRKARQWRRNSQWRRACSARKKNKLWCSATLATSSRRKLKSSSPPTSSPTSSDSSAIAL